VIAEQTPEEHAFTALADDFRTMSSPRSGRCTRVHHAVIATLNARLVPVAWNEQEIVIVAAGILSLAGHLAVIIDRVNVRQIEWEVRADQSIQVKDRPILPRGRHETLG
jgi:hypothetical protein